MEVPRRSELEPWLVLDRELESEQEDERLKQPRNLGAAVSLEEVSLKGVAHLQHQEVVVEPLHQEEDGFPHQEEGGQPFPVVEDERVVVQVPDLLRVHLQEEDVDLEPVQVPTDEGDVVYYPLASVELDLVGVLLV